MCRLFPLLVLFLLAAPGLAAPSKGSPPAAEARPPLTWTGIAAPDRLAFVARAILAGSEARPGQDPAARAVLEALLAQPGTPGTYEAAAAARALAEGARTWRNADAAFSGRLAAEAERLLGPVREGLADYGKMIRVHGVDEPAWVRGQPEVMAQALLAWMALEEASAPSSGRREAIRQGAEGLARLLRGDFSRYPFGSHFSSVTVEGRPRTYVLPAFGEPVAGASWVVERNYAASALARAGRFLEDPALLASAEREGLGALAHLAVSGRIPYGFAPRPEVEVAAPLGVAAVVENLSVLHEVLDKPVFASLAGLASTCLQGPALQGPEGLAARALVDRALAGAGATRWAGARDAQPPSSYQVIEAEDGRAVEKAFDAFPIRYPGGTPGKLAVVGRENMFWMRFDVDREDEYFFYLSFLKSDVSGGLVSVMMRIDGDRIFQVNLGGATDDPFVDMDRVAGPRPLRQGPHSFGIRFSGLLMKRPAVLDSVVVQAAVERRWMALPDGRGVLAMKSLAEDPLKVRMQELEGEGSPSWTLISGMGNPVAPKISTDRRGRVWLEMPAGGVAFLEWPGAVPGLEASETEGER